IRSRAATDFAWFESLGGATQEFSKPANNRPAARDKTKRRKFLIAVHASIKAIGKAKDFAAVISQEFMKPSEPAKALRAAFLDHTLTSAFSL
ncbi:MAG TPA: hypothetical protein VGN61_06515, partial [Verrucomicrobiae bacterium]